MDRKEVVDRPIRVGPWGGSGGSQWDLEGSICITQIIFRHGGAINSLLFKHESNGSQQWSKRFGGNGGNRTDKVRLDWPDEFLTSIRGYYGVFGLEKLELVRSLTFISNRAIYGPFGMQEGTPFSLPVSNGMIVGCHGRCGKYLDALGVYLTPTTSVPVKCDYFSSGGRLPTMKSLQINADIVSLASPRRQTCFGGISGRPWDDGVYTGVKSICLHEDYSAIRSICVEYDRNGEPAYSRVRGAFRLKSRRIKLDYPSEYLVSLCGFYGPVEDELEVIRSLTFYTNKGKYGPFGEETGIFFSTAVAPGKVVGLFGRSSKTYLVALGVHMEHF